MHAIIRACTMLENISSFVAFAAYMYAYDKYRSMFSLL